MNIVRLVVVLELAIICCPGAASAGDALEEEAASGSNIFSTAASADSVPKFTEIRGKNAAVRRFINGDEEQSIPDFRQLRMIPSLSVVQRRELKRIYDASRGKLTPLVGELRAMREKRGTPIPNGKQPLEFSSRAQIIRLRDEIREIRRKTWDEARSTLTEAQLAQFEQMRSGQLLPDSLRTPSTKNMSEAMQ